MKISPQNPQHSENCIKSSTEQTGHNEEVNIERKLSDSFNRQNSASIFFLDEEEKPKKLRNQPEYLTTRFILFPDDNIKTFWDIIVFM